MNKLTLKFILVLMLLSAFCPKALAEVRVTAQLDQQAEIYNGARFNYHIVLHGVRAAGEVDISPLSQFSPEFAGSRDYSQPLRRVINGRITESVKKQFAMSYKLTAIRPGILKLPPINVIVEGKTYTTNPVTVTVKEYSRTNKIALEMELSRHKCYIGEPLVLTVKWFIETELAKIQGAVRDYSFNVPAFISEDFYVEDADDQDRSESNTDVNGQRVALVRQNTNYKGKSGIFVSFSKILIPKRSGKITIEPSTLSVKIATGSKRGFFGREYEYGTFIAKSGKLNIEAMPIPDSGKPAEFYGLIGEYDIAASAKPLKVNVGDPITLKIVVGGNRYLKPIKRPDLNSIPGFAANFKVSGESPDPVMSQGFKIFTQTIRANNADITEIPPIPLVYFDSKKGEYSTAFSKAIPLDVAETHKLTAADAEGYTIVSATSQVEAFKSGISAHYEGLDALKDQGFTLSAAASSPSALSLWSLPFFAFVMSLIVKAATAHSPAKIAAKRRRFAARTAITQLKALAGDPQQDTSDRLVSTMREFIGDRFDLTGRSLTPLDCRKKIADVTADTELAAGFTKVMESCEQSQYSGTATRIDSSVVERVIAMVTAIEKKAAK